MEAGRLEQMADRIELSELMHRYALAIDSGDWEALRAVFTPDAAIDFGSMDQYLDGGAQVVGIEAILPWFQAVMARFPDVLHFMSNHVIDLDGDAAGVCTYMHVLHMPMGGVYHAQAVRRPEGWRIRRFRLEERSFEEAASRLADHMRSAHADAPAP